ncbi:MAG: UDP-glucose 4-epimerase [Candidatus Saccharibacteria bacterium GW2011_GWC2_48_9]|nr:MAG: UDP-glucose 4-epimerase [Candidatus Saccharibacteria bacterium GW2011_GWC2_48_9]HCH34622.1 UDP-glucose 4-epimerase GalE [Candidatus Saccharibacteria bacterium]
MNILVTGGAGYIGSHTLVTLIEAGHTPIVVDSLHNSSRVSLERVAQITGVQPNFYQLDIRDKAALSEIFSQHAIDAVIHFAGLKAVGESSVKPLLYYQNNLDSTLILLEVMQAHGVKKLVFSSSATVYGSAPIPYTESSPAGQGITNPYGQTKYIIECILRDVAASDDSLEFTALRYFNPIGAHSSGLIGEDPSGIPNNLMPYIAQVAVGVRDTLGVFGDDYDTTDGTGVRDYIHVDDLAEGHVAALTHSKPGFRAINLGSGNGTSVLELVHAFERASGRAIPYTILPRRAGDLPEFYADATIASQALNWHSSRTIDDACRDTWNWQSKNPQGYN